jgi:hypothetical protein
MRRTSILLTALCLTLGASAAFAGTAPKVEPVKNQPAKVQPATKAAPTTMKTKAGYHRHHRHQAQSPVPKKG